MKHHAIKSAFLSITLILCSTGLYASPLSAPLTFHSVIAGLNTPNALVHYMQDHFSFKDDEPLFGTADYWQSPEEFWQRKEGDCEDFALFAKRIFDLHGVESYVVSFYGDANFAHTVTVFKTEDERYSVINENKLYNYKAESIEAALTHIYPAWSWGGIAEKRGTRGWMVERLTNPNYEYASTYARDTSEFTDFPEYFF